MFFSITPDLKLRSITQPSSLGPFYKTTKKFSRCYTLDSARSCIYLILVHILKTRGPYRLFVPTFRCQSIGFLNLPSSIELVNYDVDDSLVPCAVELKPNDVFFVINYFGLSAEANFLRNIKCSTPRAKIIYDCAHAVPHDNEIFEYCDFIVYSIRKTFPTSDGGVVFSNCYIDTSQVKSSKFHIVSLKFALKIIFSLDSHLPVISFRALLINLFINRNQFIPKSDQSSNVELGNFRKISSLSKWIIKCTDTNLVYESCRDTYISLYKQLNSISFPWIARLYPISPSSSPVLFPILLESDKIANELVVFLNKRNIGAGLFWRYWGLVDPKYNRIIVLPLLYPNIVPFIITLFNQFKNDIKN